MNDAGIKESEQAVYDSKAASDRRSYDSLWDNDDMARLLVEGAAGKFHSLIDRFPTHMSLLDIGCGNGTLIRDIHTFNEESRVYGVDISGGQLRDAKELNKNVGQFVQGDGERLPFLDNSFDVVSVQASLHHLPNWRSRAIPEVRRVLKESGAFIFYEPGKYNPPAVLRRKFFPSSSHTPHEAPFDPALLEEALAEEFAIVNTSRHYIISHLIPVFNQVSPISIPTRLMNWVYHVEQRILPTSRYCWIIVGEARL